MPDRPAPTVTGLSAELHAYRVDSRVAWILIADQPQYAEL